MKGLIILLMVLGVLGRYGNDVKTGDLIFVGEGKGDFSKAISESTGEEGDTVKFVHVGIIEVEESGEVYVIEASPEEGVREIALEKFMEEVPKVNGEPIIAIKRITKDYPVSETIERAKSHLGEPYDWWYLKDNGKMYCSELVYESYIDEDGEYIFEAQPMNFRGPDGSMPQFWIELFDELKEPIPEGKPGTNPNDMAREECLRTLQIEF